MAVYTVSLNLLENLEDSEKPYMVSILFRLANDTQPDKIAVDKKMIIFTRYREASCKFPDSVKTWLDFLSYAPSSLVEKIDVDLEGIDDSEEICLRLCSKTKGAKQMIVHSLGLVNADIDEDNCTIYNGCRIRILDKDEAKCALNPQIAYSINNSIVAGRDVNKSTNNTGNEE